MVICYYALLPYPAKKLNTKAMKRKLFGIAVAVTMFVGGATFAFSGNETECPLKGTPDCPLTENTAEVPDCCKK